MVSRTRAGSRYLASPLHGGNHSSVPKEVILGEHVRESVVQGWVHFGSVRRDVGGGREALTL